MTNLIIISIIAVPLGILLGNIHIRRPPIADAVDAPKEQS